MKRFFSKENMIGLLLLFLAVAAFCCLKIGAGKREDTQADEVLVEKIEAPVPVGGWSERELGVADGAVLKIIGKKASLYGDDGVMLWTTDQALLVQDGLVTDLDGDGITEMILLLWRVGKYGKHHPFWETNDVEQYSQHIFIYEIGKDLQVKEKWCASDVGREIMRFKLIEKNNSIILTEDVEGACNLWIWDSFGLKIMENGAIMVAFGDNIIHKEIYEYAYAKRDGNFDFLYEPFYDDIQRADIAAFQQETILVDKDSAVSGYPMFGTPLGVGDAIAEAGFDVACCAGNHALDKGLYGINVTTNYYKDLGVLTVGVQSSAEEEYRPFEIVNRNGISFALLDYTYGTGVNIDSAEDNIENNRPSYVHYLPGMEEAENIEEISGGENKPEETNGGRDNFEDGFVEDIRQARESADFVVVFVHWGDEYSKEVSDYQRWITGLLAEGGADLVIGTHPHVLQDVETVKRPDGGEMLVYYSLGNFRAYQGRSEDTRVGGEAVITIEHCFEGVRIASHELKEIDAYVKFWE